MLRHRLVLSYEALAQGLDADDILHRVLSTVPAPRVTPRQADPARSWAAPDPTTASGAGATHRRRPRVDRARRGDGAGLTGTDRSVVTAPPRIAGTSTEELIRGLELQVNRRLDGLLHGDYLGLVPGHGSEPGDARAYLPGDDVRRIDWNVSARMPDIHVRETIADRELESWVLLDRSPSLDFGTAACHKRDLAYAAASAFGFLTLRTGNRFGAVAADARGTAGPAAGHGSTPPAERAAPAGRPRPRRRRRGHTAR